MAKLTHLDAWEVYDSRGRPTLEVEVTATGGVQGRATVPSASSRGRYEAAERRDGDHHRFGGKGMLRSVADLRGEVASAVVGMDPDDQPGLDARLTALDGTADRSRLGVHTLLGVSWAAARAAAAARSEEPYEHLHRLWVDRLGAESPPSLPMPLVTMISGGSWAGDNMDFRGLLMVPLGATSFALAMEMSASVYHCLWDVLKDYGEAHHLVSDDGAYAPRFRAEGHAVERVLEAAMACNYRLGEDMAIALDVAADPLFDPATGRYALKASGEALDARELVAKLAHWANQFPIVSIEDALADDDWDGWTALAGKLGASTQVAASNLFGGQADRIARGAERKAANAVVIKPAQVGTLTETFDALALARRLGMRTILSGRGGETEDTTLADLAVATSVGQVKFGAVARSEHLAKYNRLLRIEQKLGEAAQFAGRGALGPR